jgi:hypothetical protein
MTEDMDRHEDDGTEQQMDALFASAIMVDARTRARRALVVRRPVLFAVWGVAWLVGEGAIWLSVRGQRPYNGPAPSGLLTLTLVIAAAAVVNVILIGRAATGVGGSTALHRRILLSAYLAGLVAVLTLEAAIDHAGASRGVLGVYGAAAPVLLAGVVVAAGSAAVMDWSVFGLGLWLLALGAGSGFAGPVTVWAVSAIGGGGGLLVMATVGLRLSRS